MTRPVFIDGPWKGKDTVIYEGQFPIRVVECHPIHSYFNPDFDPLVDVPHESTTYYLHRIGFGKRMIAVASTSFLPPDEDQIFKTLFTRRAKAAVIT